MLSNLFAVACLFFPPGSRNVQGGYVGSSAFSNNVATITLPITYKNNDFRKYATASNGGSVSTLYNSFNSMKITKNNAGGAEWLTMGL